MKEEVPQNIEEGQLEEVEQSSTVEDAPSPDVEGIREGVKEDTHEQTEGLHQEVVSQFDKQWHEKTLSAFGLVSLKRHRFQNGDEF